MLRLASSELSHRLAVLTKKRDAQNLESLNNNCIWGSLPFGAWISILRDRSSHSVLLLVCNLFPLEFFCRLGQCKHCALLFQDAVTKTHNQVLMGLNQSASQFTATKPETATALTDRADMNGMVQRLQAAAS